MEECAIEVHLRLLRESNTSGVWITLLMTGWSIPPCVQANKQLSN
jgi:hypothetical protein